MGKLDWNSPEFRLLDDLSEDAEPVGYAFAVIGDLDRARAWVRRLVMADLLQLHAAPNSQTLNKSDVDAVLWNTATWTAPFPRSVMLALSRTGLDALQRRDMSIFERA